MKLLLIATALLVSTAAHAQTFEERQAKSLENYNKMRGVAVEFTDCVKDSAAKLGKGNSEPADTVVTAALSLCKPKETEYRNLSIAAHALEGRWQNMSEETDQYVREMYEKARPDATAAVLLARAK